MNFLSPEQTGSLFVDVLTEIMQKFTGFSLNLLSEEPDSSFDDIIGIMNLDGAKGGTVFLSAKESALRTICSFMLGIAEEEVTEEDCMDGVCELVNMTAGCLKQRLGNMGDIFTLSSPFAIRGKDLSLTTKNRIHVLSLLLGDGEIVIRLKYIW